MHIWKHLVGAVAAAALLCAGAVAEAKTPGGWNKGNKTWKGGTPPGFTKGKKTGWSTAAGTTTRMPPGLLRTIN